MIQKILTYVNEYNMIKKGDRIVIGVSGGADSICLLHVLNRLCKERDCLLYVVHVNHGIRGNEADRDEKYVKELCGRMGIPFYGYDYDVRRIARERRLSEEEAGREVRYQAFLEVCRENKCNKIAIAHNKNDNAETILFHLFRGSGVKGLCGIEPVRIISADFGNITLVRPLLCVERKEIEEYLHVEKVAYLTDSTNLSDEYSRNKIRNQILAYAVREINLGAIAHITSAAAQLKEYDEFVGAFLSQRFQVIVHEEGQCYFIATADLTSELPMVQKGILLKVMEKLAGKRKDLEAKHVEAALSLLQKPVGRMIHLPYDIIAEREYNNIVFYCKKENPIINQEEPMTPIKVEIPGRTRVGKTGKILDTSILSYKKNEPIPKNCCVKWFDYDKIENAVEIRTRKEGDYFQVNQLGGNKKLKDYLIDKKIPQKLRNNQILITDGSHVIWIPGDGERMSEKYKVNDNTKKILLIQISDLEDEDDVR